MSLNSENKSSILLGLIIIIIGGILLLNNFGTDISIGEFVATYWPLLLIYWGFDNLLQRRNKKFVSTGNLIISIIVLVIGIIILGNNLDIFNIDLSIFWKLLWPAVLIFLGINILRGSARTGSTGWAVMSGVTRKNEGWQLKDKSYIAFMGGVELDLTKADIPEGETHLDLTAVMGGIEIKVPENIKITCKGTALLGGIDFLKEGGGGIIFNRQFEHQPEGETNKELIIDCRTLMGGIEIKG